jgi:hypothetical protein
VKLSFEVAAASYVIGTKGTGQVVTNGYNGLGRPTSQALNLAGTAHDVTYGFSYNPASQIISQFTRQCGSHLMF